MVLLLYHYRMVSKKADSSNVSYVLTQYRLAVGDWPLIGIDCFSLSVPTSAKYRKFQILLIPIPLDIDTAQNGSIAVFRFRFTSKLAAYLAD